MLDRIIKELRNQFHINRLELDEETVNEFVFATDKGHITVDKETTETFSTLSGFMGVLFID